MRVHYLQHVPFEGLGSIEDWLKTAGHGIDRTRLYASEKLPELAEFDLLILMGGPMSVNDEKEHPWLIDEKRLVRAAVEAGKSVLGICLGAQLIASALGAPVYASRFKEIGWLPIRGVSSADTSLYEFPEALEVFHWHGETFELPPGAIRLAHSEACENQAFQLGRSVVGLQFHLETTVQSAHEIVNNSRDELLPSRYVQTEQGILSTPTDKYRIINQQMGRVLSFLTTVND
jgi:GMP synthase-like glutamine amidotransferase